MRTKFREIFIFIAGATPQVITETIYALGTLKQPVYPAELYVITTSEGRKRAEETLVHEGKLNALGQELGHKLPLITPESFIVPRDADGRELSDIRNEDDNERMGDLIMSFIREKTSDPYARLHCSIAGGRKTMSFYLGAALQMFGRSWDRLYHVLVSPEFESLPGFYFKPKKDSVIAARGKKLHTKDAVITLAELTFIRLREKVVAEGDKYRDLIRRGQKDIDAAIARPMLRINMKEGRVFVGKTEVPLSMLLFSIYAMYAKRKVEHCLQRKTERCDDCADCFPVMKELDPKAALREIMATYSHVAKSRAEDYLAKHEDGVNDDELRQAISKIKSAFRSALKDPSLADYYAITSLRRAYGSTKHGIRAEREMIKIE